MAKVHEISVKNTTIRTMKVGEVDLMWHYSVSPPRSANDRAGRRAKQESFKRKSKTITTK